MIARFRESQWEKGGDEWLADVILSTHPRDFLRGNWWHKIDRFSPSRLGFLVTSLLHFLPFERKGLCALYAHAVLPGVGAPMHGVDFGQMASEGASGAHLDPTDSLNGGRCLGQICITGRFPSILPNKHEQITSQHSKSPLKGSKTLMFLIYVSKLYSYIYNWIQTICFFRPQACTSRVHVWGKLILNFSHLSPSGFS